MRFVILSRNKSLHSIRRLLQEARKKGVQCDVLNPLDCQIVVDGASSRILNGPTPILAYDAILPRIGASITEYGLSVVKQFEAMGTLAINSSRAIADSRNKMRCLQVLTEAGLLVPPSVLTRTKRGLAMAVQAVRGFPVVLKVLQGTQGVGVMLIHTPIALGSVLDTLWGLEQDVFVQQFVAEGAGRDYRAFVVGNRVIAAMMRTAAEGEFRSNIHRGGEGTPVRLPRAYSQAAIRAAQAVGLEIAGVDLMASNAGPVVLEVNSSPGFEGIEKATGLNVAKAIIEHMLKKTRGQRRAKPTRRKPRRR